MTGIFSFFFYYFIVYLFLLLLRTVPTFVVAHLEILGFPVGGVYSYMDIFARLKTMRRNQTLASALGIQKENWL